jgi:hypothetical protein
MQEDAIYIWNISSQKIRKQIHEWLDSIPQICHVGIRLKAFDPSCDGFYVKKCECGQKTKLMTYHPGICENNIDEYWSGRCDSCKESVIHESNYDDLIP